MILWGFLFCTVSFLRASGVYNKTEAEGTKTRSSSGQHETLEEVGSPKPSAQTLAEVARAPTSVMLPVMISVTAGGTRLRQRCGCGRLASFRVGCL